MLSRVRRSTKPEPATPPRRIPKGPRRPGIFKLLAFLFVVSLVVPMDLGLGIADSPPDVQHAAALAFVLTGLASVVVLSTWAYVTQPMGPRPGSTRVRRPRPRRGSRLARVAGTLTVAGMVLLRALPPIPLGAVLGCGGGFLLVLFVMIWRHRWVVPGYR